MGSNGVVKEKIWSTARRECVSGCLTACDRSDFSVLASFEDSCRHYVIALVYKAAYWCGRRLATIVAVRLAGLCELSRPRSLEHDVSSLQGAKSRARARLPEFSRRTRRAVPHWYYPFRYTAGCKILIDPSSCAAGALSDAKEASRNEPRWIGEFFAELSVNGLESRNDRGLVDGAQLGAAPCVYPLERRS